MTVRIGDAARLELEDGVRWYEEQYQGLGYRFSFEIHETVKRIAAFPESYHEIDPKIRRALAKKFPYGIIYTIVGGDIEIVAVAHLHRSPYYWAERIKDQ